MAPKTIRIDGVIGTGKDEISSQMVREQLPANGTDPISVKLHSEGGSVFEGFAVHDIFAAYQGPKTLSIESSAFSIASFVATAFDDVEISSNGYMMLHNPYAQAEGDDEDFAKQSQLLGQLKSSMVTAYATRSGKSEDEIKAILKAETYLNAEQSVAMGLASRITGKPIIGRAFTKLSTMPHGVVSALFGAGSGGEKREPTERKIMSESQPVAATLQEIKAAFPKAKATFIVSCLERSLPMASVATAAVDEMMNENAALRAEVEALKASAAKAEFPMETEEEEKPAEAKAKACDEEMPAKASGVKAIAKAKTSQPSARVRWADAIQAKVKAGLKRPEAIMAADVENPGLRQSMISEANQRA